MPNSTHVLQCHVCHHNQMHELYVVQLLSVCANLALLLSFTVAH